VAAEAGLVEAVVAASAGAEAAGLEVVVETSAEADTVGGDRAAGTSTVRLPTVVPVGELAEADPVSARGEAHVRRV
jgi:hypothetical protein